MKNRNLPISMPYIYPRSIQRRNNKPDYGVARSTTSATVDLDLNHTARLTFANVADGIPLWPVQIGRRYLCIELVWSEIIPLLRTKITTLVKRESDPVAYFFSWFEDPSLKHEASSVSSRQIGPRALLIYTETGLILIVNWR